MVDSTITKRLTRSSTLLSLTIFALIFLGTFVSVVDGADSPVVHGTVIDSLSKQPIRYATVSFWDVSGRRPELKASVNTDGDGQYRASLTGGSEYRVYVYYDDQATPGFDFLPVSTYIHLDVEEVALDFALLPSASVVFSGAVTIVGTQQAPRSLAYTVVDANTGARPDLGKEHLLVYTIEEARFFSPTLASGYVIIPANMSINIKIDVGIRDRGWEYHTLLVDDQFYLDQGKLVRVDIRESSLAYNADLVSNQLMAMTNRLEEAEQNRFYVVAEKQDLATAKDLVSDAQSKVAAEQYEEGYADLKEAYLIIRGVDDQLTTMYLHATSSVDALIFFFTFTALVVAYVIADRGVTKALTTGIFYVFFFGVLYATYPGFRIVDSTSLLYRMGVSLALVSCVLFLLPRIFKEKRTREHIAFRSAVISAFSIAKRNLKRRKLRTVLTIISVTTLVLSFVAFTSFSLGYGLTLGPTYRPPLQAPPPYEGLLIKQPLPDRYRDLGLTFMSLSPGAVDWLQGQPEITLVAPKAENLPVSFALGNLSSARGSPPIQIFGVVGIQPEEEAYVTHLDECVVQGRYLQNNDVNAVLISVQAAALLDVQVGDKVVYTDLFSDLQVTIELELVGLIEDESRFSQILEIDDSYFVPQKVSLDEQGEAHIVECEPFEVMVTPWRTSLGIPGVGLSQVVTQVSDSQTVVSLARRIALEGEYWVWGSVNGQLYTARLESLVEARGLGIIIPWGIVIANILIVTVNSIYERRKEVFILSAIGLNPSHITALFVTEATIVGVIGGGIGYLLGLNSYQIMTFLVGIGVRQKVSALWCFATLGLAIVTVLAGSLFAVKTSVIVTPSLLRRWKIEKKPQTPEDPWILPMPTKIPADRIDAFLNHMEHSLREYREVDKFTERVTRIEQETPDAAIKSIKFFYRELGESVVTRNEFKLTKQKNEGFYAVELRSRGSQKRDIYKTANLLRKLLLSYTTREE